MKNDRSRYYGHRFPSEIISYAVWVYCRFSLSFRDVEDLIAERRLGDIWHLDEVFIRINGQQQYLWRAVDQDGDVIDILVPLRKCRCGYSPILSTSANSSSNTAT